MTRRMCAPGKFSIETWGPNAWSHLHTLAFLYPSSPTAEDKRHMHSFIIGFAHTIPCEKCRRHFLNMIQTEIFDGSESKLFASQEIFSRATVRWHNAVNERLGKPIMKYSDVYILYHRKYADCSFVQYGFYMILVVMLLYLVKKRLVRSV